MDAIEFIGQCQEIYPFATDFSLPGLNSKPMFTSNQTICREKRCMWRGPIPF